MRIVENDASRLVLRDRTLWITVICGAAAFFLLFTSARSHEPVALIPAALFALFAVAFLRSSDIIFDKTARICVVRRRDMWRVNEQQVAFSDIDNVLVEPSTGLSERPTIMCRLNLSTRTGEVPLSASYEPDLQRYELMRQSVVDTVFEGRQKPTNVDPVRVLVAKGRIVDAVSFLRCRDNIGLVDAKAKVEAIQKERAASAANGNSF